MQPSLSHRKTHTDFEDLQLVNYCHPDCIPMLNIMRLDRNKAFELAAKLAKEHPDTAAFYRFADFDNYYALREAQDQFLYCRFKALGGKPQTGHPLSFVIEGSEYLKEWFGNGTETRITMRETNFETVSFTIGDSGSVYQHSGTVELYTRDDMKNIYREYGNDLRKLLEEHGKKYVEVQLWTESVPDIRSAVPYK